MAETMVDQLKPFRDEARLRIRNSILAFIALVILPTVLPIPSPFTCLAVVINRSYHNSLRVGICTAELLILTAISLNTLQASYALAHPRKSTVRAAPPKPQVTISSPAKKRLVNSTSPMTPSLQKSFSASTSSFKPSSSTFSTPSRPLQFSITSPPSAGNTPFNASFPSPSSPLAAYRSRHSQSTGRALDGSLLSRLHRGEESGEEDEEDQQ